MTKYSCRPGAALALALALALACNSAVSFTVYLGLPEHYGCRPVQAEISFHGLGSGKGEQRPERIITHFSF